MIIPVRGLTSLINGVEVPVNGLTITIPDILPPTSGIVPEIGSWLPVVGGDGGESGQQYSSQFGHYCRIGPFVTLWAYTQFTNKGNIIGNLALKNLPFPTKNLPGFYGGLCAYFSNFSPNAAQVSNVLIYTGGNQAQAAILGVIPASNPRNLNGDDLNNATQLIFTLSYLTP